LKKGTRIPYIEDTKASKGGLVKAPGFISQKPLPQDHLGADVQQKQPLQHRPGCETPWMPLSHPSHSPFPNPRRALCGKNKANGCLQGTRALPAL